MREEYNFKKKLTKDILLYFLVLNSWIDYWIKISTVVINNSSYSVF